MQRVRLQEGTIRIAFLSRSLERGGAERQLAALAAALRSAGHDVTVFTFYPGGGFEKDIEKAGVPVASLGKWGRWDVFRFTWRLKRALRGSGADVVYSYLPVPNILTAALRPFLGGAKIAWGARASFVDLSRYDSLTSISYRLETWMARFADVIIVNSRAGRDLLIEKGFPSGKVTVVHNGVDTERFNALSEARRRVRAEWGAAPETKVIGLPARIDPMKDHATFLLAARGLLSRRDDVLFVLAGGGPERLAGDLRSRATELGVADRLLWLGEADDMPAVYNGFDIVTLTSVGEGFPNAVAEAMACGVPCVVTDVGDAAEIVGETGVVAPPGDSAAIASGWDALLRRLDKEGGALKKAARARIVDRYSVPALVDGTLRALEAAL